jgi:ribosome-associated protein
LAKSAHDTGRTARRPGGAPDDRELALTCARLALDRQARDVRLLFVGDRLGIADFFVLATVNNRRQARAVRDAIRAELKAAGAGVPLAASEDPDGRWSLYDYGGVVVHLFDDEGRAHFGLDDAWRDVPEIRVPAEAPRPRARDVDGGP